MRYSKRRLDSSANERCREEVIADQVVKMALAMPHFTSWMLEGKRLLKAIAETLMSALLTERACSSS